MRLSSEFAPDALLHHQKFDPEFHGLLARPLRKLSPSYPSREAHVVLDHARRARLAPDRVALDDDGAQTFRSRVNGSRQSPAGPAP